VTSVSPHYLSLEEIDTRFMVFRIHHPELIEKIKKSMDQNGQHQPVLVRQGNGQYQLLDGFKRYHAAGQLGWTHLEVKLTDVAETTGLAMIISCNKATRGLIDYEEALIVQNLQVHYLMNGQEISELLGYSSTWVCRRLALIEKLEKSVQESLRMGQITSGHARELIKLPRGNQSAFLTIIIGHNLTTGQARLLIEKYIQSVNKQESQWVLSHPKEAIENSLSRKEISDNRLTQYGNRLLKAIELLLLQQHIFHSQYTHHQRKQLTDLETDILSVRVCEVLKKAKTIVEVIANHPLTK
jgi:ParB/RepB/Spo0J family partition protein